MPSAADQDRPRVVAVGEQEIPVGCREEEGAEEIAACEALHGIGIGVVKNHELTRLGRLVREVERGPAVCDHPVTPAQPRIVEKPGVGEEVLAEVPYSQVLYPGFSLHGGGLLLEAKVKRVVEQVDEGTVGDQDIRLRAFHGVSVLIEQARVRVWSFQPGLVQHLARDGIESI